MINETRGFLFSTTGSYYYYLTPKRMTLILIIILAIALIIGIIWFKAKTPK